MANDLHSEVIRHLMLRAARELPPQLQSAILSDNPNEAQIVSGLKAHNDELHSNLTQNSGEMDHLAKTVALRKKPNYR